MTDHTSSHGDDSSSHGDDSSSHGDDSSSHGDDSSSTRNDSSTQTTDASARDTDAAVGRSGSSLETHVDDADAVAATCAYCDRPFVSRAAHDLHVGDVHAAVCTDAEAAAYEDALEAERDDLFYFHLKVVAALAVLYTVVVLAYMVALGSGFL